MVAILRFFRRRFFRYVAIGFVTMLAILVVAVLVTLRIDLGPRLRGLAEREGSKQIQRPLHIGRLMIRVARGRVEVENFRIDGLNPGDRPFFEARLLSVSLDWSRLVQRRPEIVITSVELADWNMLVEKWKGSDSFLRLRRSTSTRPPGPRRFVTTLKYVHALRGQFAYEDHETPWGILAPNIDIVVTNSRGYNGDESLRLDYNEYTDWSGVLGVRWSL